MSRLPLIATVAGAALIALSLFADTIGVGGEPGFGWKQGIGVGVGAAVVLIGLLLGLRERAARPVD